MLRILEDKILRSFYHHQKTMRGRIFLSLIFLSLLPTKVFSSELRNQYFCRILAEEVGQNVFNRNQQYIPNWIKPFINNQIFTNSKCLFLLTLEKYADEYVSTKYEIKVVEEFNNQIKNFSF